MSTNNMPTDEEKFSAHRDWGSELSNKGWDLEGIKLENEDTMTAIFKELGIPEDFKRQSQLVGYIKKHKQQPQPHQWGSELGEGWPVDGIDLGDTDMMKDIYKHLGIQNDSSSRAQFRAYIKKHKQQQQQENDPYTTPRTKSQPEKNKLSATLKRALEKLKNKQIDLNDLSTDNEHKGWSDIETRAEFSPLELSAVQNSIGKDWLKSKLPSPMILTMSSETMILENASHFPLRG